MDREAYERSLADLDALRMLVVKLTARQVQDVCKAEGSSPGEAIDALLASGERDIGGIALPGLPAADADRMRERIKESYSSLLDAVALADKRG